MDDELIRLLLSDINDLTYIYDTEGNILFVNKIFEKFTGHRPEEFYGKPFISLFNESHAEKAMDSYRRTLKGESPRYELSFKNTKVVCEYRNFPLRDEKGNIIGVMGIARNISSRRHGEEELKILKESLEKRVVEYSGKLQKVNEELMEEISNRKCLEGEFKRTIDKLHTSLRGVIQAMALAIELKDAYAAGHQKRVARLARCVAEEIGLSQERIDGVSLAATLHDIGKISIPTELLCKIEQLTENEYMMLKSHPQIGYDIIKEIEFPYPIAQIVLQHHERIDGSGYPLGLSGKDILLEAKILGVADVVEAMISPRPYRQTLDVEKVLAEISRNRGILYDGNVVHACLLLFREKGFRFEPEEPYSNLRLFEDVLLKV
jgi:PAS domain S-box-containing protein/putative nucleotidyltransferase with HDIG domain